jgi:trigger factor
MYDNNVNEMIQEFDMLLRSQGLDFDTYMQYMGATRETLIETYKPEAEKRVKLRLALEKIAEKEAIEVTEEELDAEYTRLADLYKMDKEEVKKVLTDDSLSGDLKSQKAMDLVIGSVKNETKKSAEAKSEEE